jgi:hypothetical protein
MIILSKTPPDATPPFNFITKRPCARTRTWRLTSTVPPTYKEKIMRKQVLICTAVVTMLMVNPVIAQQSAPTYDKAK